MVDFDVVLSRFLANVFININRRKSVFNRNAATVGIFHFTLLES